MEQNSIPLQNDVIEYWNSQSDGAAKVKARWRGRSQRAFCVMNRLFNFSVPMFPILAR